MQINNKRIDNIITMIQQQQNETNNLLVAGETLTTGTLTSYLLPHTTLQNILDHVSQTF